MNFNVDGKACLNFNIDGKVCLNFNIEDTICLNLTLYSRACLNLITDTPETVLHELDLIQSLALLDGFGVNILPIQGQYHCQGRYNILHFPENLNW